MSNTPTNNFKSARALSFEPEDGFVPSYRRNLAAKISQAQKNMTA